MKLKYLVFTVLFLTEMMLIAVPAMAKNSPPPQTDRVVELTSNLKNYVAASQLEIFRGFIYTYSQQQQATLIKKIDDVIKMFEKENYQAGYNKLNNDIAPKLADPRPTPRTSWLSQDPEYEAEVTRFAGECQELILQINLADPRPTP